ncbi:PAS domain S-box-containing protein/diguanylate cyclase (GGDEF) domain-containing protein [Halomonas korlensis]|uniref:PAS domain S-box-containing protein/diguanylate cyclase (GGDEF) domain-containing protein n=2 Tax=Halomonas korlensis TaxID=463301 RepID=A0A1I7HXD1_9GAMM|nr:diguanylate cyclase [Halomonas korlensis]SFU65136.1 PAS domain S-box-containing protein/diguanylate cyclase (GGDEF) domain-containing protein [Halomonas korlensis]
MLGLAITWVVVALLLLGAAGWIGRSLISEVNFTHLSYESRVIAEELSTQVDQRLGALQRLEAMLGEQGHARLREELRHNTALLEWFDGLVVADAQGVVQADWPEMDGRVGLETKDTEYFRFLRAVQRPYVSEPFTGRASDKPLVLFTVPRWRDGEFNGFVGGFVDIRSGELFARLQRLRLGDGGYAAVATASGTILYHPQADQILQPVPSLEAHPLLHRALDGWEGKTVTPMIGGGEAYQSFNQIWPADWIVGVALPEKQVLEPMALLIQWLWWGGAAFALLTLPVMWGLVRRTLSPLHRLARQIHEVGEGRRSRIALATHMHELINLADTFNRVEAERSEAHLRLSDRQAFLDAVLASSPLGMFVTDMAGRFSYMNPALKELTGHDFTTRGEVVWLAHIHTGDRDSAMDLWRHSLASGDPFLQQFRFLHANGDTLWLEVHASLVSIQGRNIGFVGTVKDITERYHEDALRRWEAEHDPLTGLLNRRGFERRLEEALAEWHKTGTPSALILFDLDHFKPVNDEGGHALGDEMLRRIAQVLAWEVRRSDYVARQGGDEFAVLLPSCTLEQAKRVADTVRCSVREVYVVHQGQEFRVSLSIGVTAFRGSDHDTAAVIARADAASYHAKEAGRDRVMVATD